MLCCRALTLSGFRRLTGIMRDINLLIWIMTRASRLTGMCIVTWGGLGDQCPPPRPRQREACGATASLRHVRAAYALISICQYFSRI